MKTITIFSTIIVLLSNPVFAQRDEVLNNSKVNGIFLNISDFKRGVLTCKINNPEKDEKIKLHQFITSPKIECVEQGRKTVFLKDSIFLLYTHDEWQRLPVYKSHSMSFSRHIVSVYLYT